MGELLSLLPEWFIFIAANFLLTILLFFMNLSLRSKLKNLSIKYNKFMSGVNGENVEHLLEECISKTNLVISRNKENENHINGIERSLLRCIQKVGIVRYNAFDNVGSDLSFSIALLNENDDGIALSGLYSRESSNSYAKPIIGGKSKYALSAEEIKAIDIAIKSHTSSMYID